MFDSFAEYAEFQYDQLWDEYLDWLAVTGLELNADSVEEWMGMKADRGEISTAAEHTIRDYVSQL